MKKRLFLIVSMLMLVTMLAACGSHQHNWVEETCTEPKTCSSCGETEGEPNGHKWVEATCAAPKTCSVCGETEGEALPHTWSPATCTAPMTCSVCGVTSGNPLEHTWVDATCTEPKTCSVCGTTEGTALGHDTPDLSCTQDSVCTRCGEEVPALGHEWVEATCTEPKTCTRCGETEGAALGHTPAESTRENESAATCTEPGQFDEVVYCSVCNEELSRTTKTEPALGHSAADPVKENVVSATCTDDGKYDEVVYCSVCNEELSRTAKTEPALGHTTSSGTCSRCGNEVYETITGSGDDVVDNITVGDGIYRVHFTNSGSSNFVVRSYDSTNDRELLINEIGAYDGYVFLSGSAPYIFEIQSSGKWSFTIERLTIITGTSFSGRGDYVTNIFSGSSGTYEFTHDGRSNFVIRIYTTNGRSLLVNEIGSYSGKKIVTIPSGSNAFFEINADGNWTIKPAS